MDAGLLRRKEAALQVQFAEKLKVSTNQNLSYLLLERISAASIESRHYSSDFHATGIRISND
eukprot:9475433-Pyramimonas_sp.AAC.2